MDKSTTELSYPTMRQAVVLVLLFMLIAAAVELLLLGFERKLTGINSTGKSVFSLVTGYLVPIVMVITIAYKNSRRSFNEVFIFRKFNLLLPFALLFFVPGASILFSEADNLVRNFFTFSSDTATVNTGIAAHPAVLFIVFVLFAPLCEEMLFRGIILSGFLRQYPVNKSIPASSVLFAFIHLDLRAALGAFFLGLFLGYLYDRTRSLWPCIITHTIWNGLNILVYTGFSGIRIPGFTPNTGNTDTFVYQPLWFDFCGFGLMVAGIAWVMYIVNNTYENR
jgi:membrane protease YdiL (CAAX protease family)